MTPWTVAHQTLLSMGFPRQEHWRGLSFPPPGDLPNAGMESMYPALADGFCITEPPGESGLGSNSETAVYMRGRGRTDSRREERTPHFCQVKKLRLSKNKYLGKNSQKFLDKNQEQEPGLEVRSLENLHLEPL